MRPAFVPFLTCSAPLQLNFLTRQFATFVVVASLWSFSEKRVSRFVRETLIFKKSKVKRIQKSSKKIRKIACIWDFDFESISQGLHVLRTDRRTVREECKAHVNEKTWVRHEYKKAFGYEVWGEAKRMPKHAPEAFQNQALHVTRPSKIDARKGPGS